jgi:hypothetical protein
VLSIFHCDPEQGINRFMDTDDMNFRSFLDRASAILPGLEEEQVRQVKIYLSPNAVKNPCDL